MPEWQIDAAEYFKRLYVTPEDFEKQLALPDIGAITKVIPLRAMKDIQSVIPISAELLLYLIQRIKTVDGQAPFTNSRIRLIKKDPHDLKIGQKFVYRENYQSLLEELPDMFQHFLITTGGLGDLGAYFVFGKDIEGAYTLACYIPPLIEKHGSDYVIMDGIHRNYIAKQAGKTLSAIVIDNVAVPFPCAAKEWSNIKVISLAEKPNDLHARFFSLKKGLFRDLKYLGIDG